MRDFLKYTLASFMGLVLFCSLGVGGLIFLLIAAAKDSGPQVKDKSVLVFDLALGITDTNPSSSTGQAFQEALSGDDTDTVTLRTVLDSLDQAAKDRRIVGLYLKGSENATSSGSGFATLKEVREALERFRATGKPIVAYDMDWTEREYYLGSVANTIVVNPIGVMRLNGLSSQTTFLTGALQKYGVGVQVTRVGKYKSAVEPFLRTKSSPESQQQTQVLLNDLWGEFLSTVGKNRKLGVKQLQAIADQQGVVLADEALKRGLVDQVAYFDQVTTKLKQLTGNDEEDKSFRQINLRTYADVPDKSMGQDRTSKNKVAVVYAEGNIVDGQGGVRDVGGDRLARQLRDLRLDDDVKAVVLRVNSPGGSATASEVIQREARLLQKQKPLVVSMGDLAASGGYWISTYANRIFAEPNTITGSIGVFGLSFNVQKLANNQGITWDSVKTARYADSQTVVRPKSAQELAVNQRIVDQIYDRFLSKVAESRKIPKPRVNEIAQGRVWSGLEAKKIGLIDEIGGLESAIRDAAKRAQLGNDWELEEYPKTRSLEERILKKLVSTQISQSAKSTDPLTAQFQKFREDLAALGSLNDPLGVYARLPYNLQID